MGGVGDEFSLGGQLAAKPGEYLPMAIARPQDFGLGSFPQAGAEVERVRDGARIAEDPAVGDDTDSDRAKALGPVARAFSQPAQAS